ncbi:MAG TPA: aldolase/citrate lyase family protein [Bacteroidales bacterium]|nr:aldolase/citrate lyase family protein [Bacteroidales bacterium]
MKKSVAVTGNFGPKVRSDCEITLEIKHTGGISFELNSKVKALYGKSIKSQCLEILKYFDIQNARLTINDSGALPFVISARLEAAVKEITDASGEYLPDMIPENTNSTTRERFRYSRLYLPGNTPGLMINSGLHSADGIILDFEDSVAPDKKDESRYLVRNALRQINFYGAERMVRINQGERGLEDLEYVIPHYVNLILIPKCEDSYTVAKVENRIKDIQERHKISNEVFLMPVIESALGIENVTEIARSGSVAAMAIGLEDYTSDLGVQRTFEGLESLYARSRLIVASKAIRIQPIDSVFSDVNDLEGLRKTVLSSKAMGFEGMGCIHPRQIAVIKEGFAPDAAEIEKSKDIVRAFEDARALGLGVVALGSKMIDAPVVNRAQRTLNLARKLGLLNDNLEDTNQ